jgi:signal transduction histidine kinase
MGAGLQNGERKMEMKKRQWTHGLPAKIFAFFLLTIMACLTVGSAAGASLLMNHNFYTKSINEIKEDTFYSVGHNVSYTILRKVLSEDVQNMAEYCRNRNLSAVISDKDGRTVWSNYSGEEVAWKFEYNYSEDNTFYGTVKEVRIFIATEKDETTSKKVERLMEGDASEEDISSIEEYTVQMYLKDGFPNQSEFSAVNLLVNIGFALRYWIYPIGILALLLTVGSFVFLICNAGHKAGQEGIHASEVVRIPFDLLTLILILAVSLAVNVTEDFMYRDYPDAIVIANLAAEFMIGLIVGTFYCMNFAVRVKLGSWWRNTVIYKLLVLFARIGKIIGWGLSVLLRNLTFIWKAAILVFVITLAELLGIMICYWETDNLIILWILEKIILIPVILYVTLVLHRLQKGSQAIAKGDLSYQVDTRFMLWDFKQHGENLNSIGSGMTHAVEDRLKSERFKTELITNVSHDIKTPLTSIINYADLICKEETENEKVTEYAGVLLRQSERLKKLIENLVEASKASTGNIDVHLTPCEVGVLLTQTAGEYEQRLRDSNLELIIKQQSDPVMILADGRHIWRVFDNLMNNICKYAQSGTRVYLNVEEKGREVVIAFKNTSKYPLDISTEELLERFVRGDSSRTMDGNGLGLSIAQSLTELQNGNLELTVDADLFKVILRFKNIR